ncbi:MAG: Coenzyme F420 hydrogenase/dehydrogenase, beta subunit C-terminal domain [Candidatus Phocaeicola faecipullorum]|nr:Coenzyme F420 hydrogenase/dehydrogenase, beta subunit C-terminal domain [Candidatus Phocaeicola faecipullorum]
MNRIVDDSKCYGCGVCAIVCPKNIIEIKLNSDGFYSPKVIDSTQCIDCGLCKSICAYQNTSLAVSNSVKQSFAGWSNNDKIRYLSSSGGVSYEICKYLLSKDYKICVVRYNNELNRAEHYIANNEKELYESIGSKYIQSYTVDAFRSLNLNDKYVLIGTPCQIDSYRRYIKKLKVENNFILIDFFCHAVPSMLAWKKYLSLLEKRNIINIKQIAWRNKKYGWHDSWVMTVVDSNNITHNFRKTQKDLFYKLFLGDYCSNPACSQRCKYKYDKSSADIRIGDFWGQTYSKDENGVSSVVAFTEKGFELLKNCDLTLMQHSFEIVAEGQMRRNIVPAYTSVIARSLLKCKHVSLDSLLWKGLFIVEKSLKFIKRKIKI